ncbi:FGGY-family carbohydrate kinase [bacterium]|nr:FGGY-family carbohydrate kinase [bacterium]
MAEQFIIAHDMGSSGDKAIATTLYGEILGEVKIDYPMHHPKPGWAEQNPDDLWEAVCATTRAVLKKCKIRPAQVEGLVFSSQTQCIIPVDKKGTPLRPLISWLDGRGAEIIQKELWTPPRLMGYNIFKLIRFLTITGGCPGQTGKDQIAKLLWLRAYEPDVFNSTDTFLDAKDYIIMKLTGRRVTSADLAYIWWMMDSRNNRNQWHPGLCRLGGVTPDRLPEVKPGSEIVGTLTAEAAKATGLTQRTMVINGCGDLAATALGSGALKDGEMHLCIGTSGWVAGHVTKRKIDIPHYTGCVGSSNPDRTYLAMAHQETVGICLEWLKDHVLYHKGQLLKEYRASEIYQVLDELAERVGPGAEGLIFTPWMYGERCPLDDEFVRAGLYNVGLNHSREHIVRALFEGVAMNLKWALLTLEKLYDPVEKLHMIGGGAKSDIWCQITADVTDRVIHRVSDPQQAGAKGMALLASMALGHIPSYEDIGGYLTVDRVFTPNPDTRRLYDRLFDAFKRLYRQNKSWFRRMHTILEESKQ